MRLKFSTKGGHTESLFSDILPKKQSKTNQQPTALGQRCPPLCWPYHCRVRTCWLLTQRLKRKTKNRILSLIHLISSQPSANPTCSRKAWLHHDSQGAAVVSMSPVTLSRGFPSWPGLPLLCGGWVLSEPLMSHRCMHGPREEGGRLSVVTCARLVPSLEVSTARVPPAGHQGAVSGNWACLWTLLSLLQIK